MNPHDYVWGMDGVGMMPMASAPWGCPAWGCMPCLSESFPCKQWHMRPNSSKPACQLAGRMQLGEHSRAGKSAVYLALRSSVQSHLLLCKHTLQLHAVACLSGGS